MIFSSCKEDQVNSPAPVIDGNNNGYETRAVAEVLVNNCALSGCHAGTSAVGGLSFESYEKMLKGSSGRPASGDTSIHHGPTKASHGEGVTGGESFISYDAERSLAYRLISGNVEEPGYRMPYGKNKLSDSQIDVVRNWINNGLKNNKGEVPFTDLRNTAIVCSQGSDQLYFIDPAAKVTVRTLKTDFISGKDSPHHVQISGDYFYVTLISAGKFLKFSRATLQLIGAVDNLVYPGMILLDSESKTAYVSKSSTAAGSFSEIYVINTETMTKTGELIIPVAGIPHGIAINTIAKKLFAANLTKDRITVFDLTTGETDGNDIILSAGSVVEHEPMHIYLSTDKTQLYVMARKSAKLLIVDIQTRSVVQEIAFASHPMQAAVGADGRVYVMLMHSNSVAVLQNSNGRLNLITTITDPSFTKLYGTDLSADGKLLFVTGSNSENGFKPRYSVPGTVQQSTVSIINTSTYKIEKILELGSYSTGIAAR